MPTLLGFPCYFARLVEFVAKFLEVDTRLSSWSSAKIIYLQLKRVDKSLLVLYQRLEILDLLLFRLVDNMTVMCDGF